MYEAWIKPVGYGVVID